MPKGRRGKVRVGKGCPASLWQPSLAPLYPAANPHHLLPHDTFQSFHEFLDMGRREPNSEGTGRWKPTPTRRTVAVVEIGAQKRSPHLSAMVDAAGAYFGLPVRVHPATLQVDVLDGELCMVDLEEGAAFPLRLSEARRKGKRARRKVVTTLPVDVFSVLHVLEEYVADTDFALIALVPLHLREPDQPDVPILGRACGDRVACVSTLDVSLRALVVTGLHETLHTFGLDHCTDWHCIMNSAAGDDDEDGEDDVGGRIHLCPLDLRKLLLSTTGSQAPAAGVVLPRFQALRDVYERLKWHRDVRWLQGRMGDTSRPAAGAGAGDHTM